MARVDSLLCAACLMVGAAHASAAEPRASDNPPLPPSRRVELGFDTGLARRPASGSDLSYATGVLWGGHIALPLASWLAFRATAAQSAAPVTLRKGALGLADTEVSQPDLNVLFVSARLEPTWKLSSVVRLWAGPEVAWIRTTAREPTTKGALVIRTAIRHGVALEVGGSVGSSLEVIPDWLVLGLSVGAFTVLDQGGTLHDRVQGFDQNGHMLKIGRYPKFAGSFRSVLGLGVLF
ncbi:MAG: hypothetical protein JW940_05860 [Polyangiaceae bacterium]|nr:hypothetical protein [Polyangiaceae bacterium]